MPFNRASSKFSLFPDLRHEIALKVSPSTSPPPNSLCGIQDVVRKENDTV